MTILKKIGLFFFLIILVSCNSNQKKQSNKNALRINIVSEPQSLDPRKARDLRACSLCSMFFDGLSRVSNEGEVELAIADNCVISDEGKVYTFKLKNTFWSNGDKLTSYDFAYTWKKTLQPDFISSMAFQLYVIKNAKLAKENKVSIDDVSIKTPDENTLIVELEHPAPFFLRLLSTPVFSPINKRIDQENPQWSLDQKSYVNNGAFKISNWKHNDSIKIVKNDNYYAADIVKLNDVLLVMLDDDTELRMYEKNQLDWAGSPFSALPVDSLKELKKRDDFNVQNYLGTRFLRVNVNKIGDKSFRQALFNSIDRKTICDHILQGNQQPTKRLVPSDEKMSLDEVIVVAEKKDIVLTYINGDSSHIIAQKIQRDIEDSLDIKVTLEAVERQTYYDRIYSNKYELALGSWIADFDDPINFLDVFKYKDSSTNNTAWENEEYIKLLDQANSCMNITLRSEILKQAEDILLEEVPIIPLYHLSQLYLKNETVQNINVSPSGIMDLREAYFK